MNSMNGLRSSLNSLLFGESPKKPTDSRKYHSYVPKLTPEQIAALPDIVQSPPVVIPSLAYGRSKSESSLKQKDIERSGNGGSIRHKKLFKTISLIFKQTVEETPLLVSNQPNTVEEEEDKGKA